MERAHHRAPDTLPETIRDVHRIASLLFVALALAATVMAFILAVQLRKVVAAVVSGVFFLFAFGTSITGSLLDWDQLALWAVTVGTSYRGFWDINSDQVRYVLLDGHEVSTETFLRWFWVHTADAAVALIGLAVLLLRFSARSRGPEPTQRAENGDLRR